MSWQAFIATVQMGGALPVTFTIDGDQLVVEVIVPYVQPERVADASPNKIPFGIATGFPIPVSARVQLPAFDAAKAPHFIRGLVRKMYQHEIDEQLCIGGQRPFAPNHA